MATAETQSHKFKAEVSQVLSLVINSLYSHKEIFLRELISNAADALDKLRFQAITKPALLGDDPELAIRIIADEEAGTLTVWDNGIGMTSAELKKNLGTIAHSGSQAFLEKMQAAAKQSDELSLIGQFGVGFYSSFLVADRVEVVTRAAGKKEALRWSSDGTESYEVGPAERENRGTSVILHFKDEHKEFLGEWRLRTLIKQYSDYISHPIQLPARPVGEDETPPEEPFETVNQAAALWQRPASEISDDQYDEFYKHLTHDWEPPLGRTHFKIEGTQLFTGLLFVPKRPPFGLFQAENKHGVRLHVKRVFIMDECEDLLPKWLRFMRGVIDSDDLPLNVSRELLQDSRLVQAMRKQVVKKSLDLIADIAANHPEDYKTLWEQYGAILKEGLHFEPKQKDRLINLLRFESSKADGPTSLREYVDRMPEDQPAIYYAIGHSLRQLESSPHLEVLKKQGWEVIYMTDTIDQWAVGALDEFEDRKLVSAMTADLDLDGDKKEDKEEDKSEAALQDLRSGIEKVLAEQIAEVRISNRLASSPACLVIPEGGMATHIEMLLRANGQEVAKTKRIFEINPEHTLISGLEKVRSASPESEEFREWVELLYDQAVLAEGMPLEDPSRLASRMTRLMESAMGATS